jgi:single-strand DNA-binding protein
MNSLTIIGNLTKDPEMRTTQSGKNVCSFWVAVNQRRKDAQGNPITDFFRVSAWNSLADICGKYLAKGKKVAVSGSVTARAFQTQAGEIRSEMDVTADTVEFLSPSGAAQLTQDQSQTGFAQVEQPDDDLPF